MVSNKTLNCNVCIVLQVELLHQTAFSLCLPLQSLAISPGWYSVSFSLYGLLHIYKQTGRRTVLLIEFLNIFLRNKNTT